MRVVEQTPDLGHCWVRFALRPWPGSDRLWVDLTGERLGQTGPAAAALEAPAGVEQRDDVLYLPPVADRHEKARAALAMELESAGVPVLVQSLPGQARLASAVTAIYDVLETVATEEISRLDTVPAEAAVLWPLIGGYTDDPSVWDEGLKRLAGAGVRCVQGMVIDLPPADRRRVVDVAGERGFEQLFHGPLPSARAFAAMVYRVGLAPFLARPEPKGPPRLVHNRRLAGCLTAIADLWLRLGRLETRGQAFYRAARWVDREPHDLMVLAREGNLGVVSWLDSESRKVIEELATDNVSSLLQELQLEYLQPPLETEGSTG